jgi:hypothetical protein
VYVQLFTANQNKPREIDSILLTNKSKILRFVQDFTIEKGKKITCYYFDTTRINLTVNSKRFSLALIYSEDRLLESDKDQVSKDILAIKL